MRTIDVALGLIPRGDRWFLQRRDPRASVLPGLWEFPGGKLQPGETPEDACRRELAEELGLGGPALEPLPPLRHDYGSHVVVLHPFLVSPIVEPRTKLAWGWFSPSEMRRLPIPEANGPLIDRLPA